MVSLQNGCVLLHRSRRGRLQWRMNRKRNCSSIPEEGSRRLNPLGIQMLSKPLYQQIFRSEKGKTPVDSSAVNRSIDHLRKQKLWGKEGSCLPDLDIKLPTMHGKSIDEHFRAIAGAQGQPYLELAKKLVATKLHPKPVKWSSEPGWTHYNPQTGEHKTVMCPTDDALVLDVETCVPESQRPILAVAVSPRGWYSWTSQRLHSSEDYMCNMERDTVMDDLIPLEISGGEGVNLESNEDLLRHRIIVGHNVSYDRARIKEQYFIKSPSKTKFLDTLSLHVCVAGQTSHQKGIWMSRKKKKAGDSEGVIPQRRTNPSDFWMEVTCPNNLSDVHWLHVRRGKRQIDKKQRDVFVKGCVQDIRDDFQNLMRYCAEDVLCTHEVLQKVFPQFLSRCPHPVTFAGMLEMGSPYLPLDSSWRQYTDDAEFTYEEMENEIKSKLMFLANEACSYLHNKRYLISPWLCNLDWSAKKFRGKTIKTKSARSKLFGRLEEFYQNQNREFSEGSPSKEKDSEEFIISSLEANLPKRPVHMPGYPEWYRSLCMKRSDASWKPGPVNVTAQTRVTPYLLRMKWNGHPLHYHDKLGWGYIISPRLVPGEAPIFDSDNDMSLNTERWCGSSSIDSLDHLNDLIDENLEKKTKDVADVEMGVAKTAPVDSAHGEEDEDSGAGKGWAPCNEVTPWGITADVVTLKNSDVYYFFKIPHKDGTSANCGNPLSKDFLIKMEEGTLTSAAGQLGQRILVLNSMISSWRSTRKRILDQFVVSLKEKGISSPDRSAIIPLVQVAGTVTRRAVEPTWLTASNAKEKRVGSELKAMVRAPPGYHLVGADVDSQELWIAAILGDMHFTRIHGSTGVGWMTLQGTKVDGTDVHSNTAATIGIGRDQAKILNYGRIYGAGLPFIKLLLRKFNPSLSNMEIETRANTLYAATKGERVYQLNREGERLAKDMGVDVSDGFVNNEDFKLMSSAVGYFKAMSMAGKRVWHGGSESHLFNQLEGIASSELPRTPVLGCCISKALQTKYVGGKYQPSKVNWVVQSSAVDYLHLMLVCTRWLFEKYNIEGQFCISIHDEVRYLVRSEDRYRAALALQYANLLTRAMFAYQLKMYDLPQSVAFFSAVDIDLVLRKEPSMDCITPSNPLGLERGHGIPPGEALDIYQLLEKTNGTL